MDFEKVSMNLILIGIFSLAFLLFMVTSARENQAFVSIADNSHINDSINNLKNSLINYQSNINSSYNSFNQDNPTVSFGSLIFGSIGNIAKSIPTVTLSAFSFVFDVIKYGFTTNNQISQIVAGVLLGGLLILVIIVIWKLIKIGL